MSWPPPRSTYAPQSSRDADPAERFESWVWRQLSLLAKVPRHECARACAMFMQQVVEKARVFGVNEFEREQQARARRAREGAFLRRDVPR